MLPGSGFSSYLATLSFLVWLSFVLHVWRLGHRDFWGDEVASLSLALEPLGDALRALATFEPHPPLYTLVLHCWMPIAGISEFAVRYPSLIFGVAAVPVGAALGTRLGGRLAGLLAGAVVAISPLVHWYAQEARMYAPLLFFGGWATLELVRAIEHAEWARARYALALSLAAYAHYYGLVLGAVHAAVVGGWLLVPALRRGPVIASQRLVYWLPVAGGVVLGLLPWLLFASQIVTQYQGVARGEIDVVPILRDIWLRFALGWSVEPPAAWWAAAPILALAVLGLFAGLLQHGRPRIGAVVVAASVVGPVLLGALVSIVRPMYAERYLVVGLVPFCVLVALGIGWLWQLRRPLAVLGIVVPIAFLGSLQNDALDPLYRKSEYSKLGEIEQALKAEGEKTLLVGGSQYYLHWYYGAKGEEPVLAPEVPPFDLDRERPRLDSLLAGARGVWLYLYALPDYDPSRKAERWADETLLRGEHVWAANAELIYYGSTVGARLEPRVESLEGDGIGVDRIEVGSGPYAAGEPVPVVLRLSSTPSSGVHVALRIVDAQGMLWGQLDTSVQTADSEAIRPGFAVRIAPGAPVGEYRLLAQFYGSAGPIPLRTANEELQTIDLGTIEVDRHARSFTGNLVPAFRAIEGAVAGGSVLGASGGEVAEPGGRAFVYLAWRSDDANGPLPARFVLEGTDLFWPVEWRVGVGQATPGDVVVVQQNLDLPSDIERRAYPLVVIDDAGHRVDLGPLRVGIP